MTEEARKATVAAQMERLAAVFGARIQPRQLEGLWDALHHLPADRLEVAVTRAMVECERMPAPKVLIALARPTSEDGAICKYHRESDHEWRESPAGHVDGCAICKSVRGILFERKRLGLRYPKPGEDMRIGPIHVEAERRDRELRQDFAAFFPGEPWPGYQEAFRWMIEVTKPKNRWPDPPSKWPTPPAPKPWPQRRPGASPIAAIRQATTHAGHWADREPGEDDA